jgi:cytochrome P450
MTMKECENSDSKLAEFLNNYNDKERVGSNILLLAFAGHDTTGHTLTWLLYELCKNPIHKKKLIDEIDLYWLNNKEASYNSLNELPFMTKCIFETLRLWPTLANGTYRELEDEEEITGSNGEIVTLKKGTYVQIFNWIKHRNPELWGDTVNIFDPEREFKDDEIWNKPFNLYHIESERFSPFTYSPRNCLGKNFAHIEMRLILLNILKNHDFRLTSEQALVKEDKLSCNYFTMGPRDLKNKNIIAMYFNVFKRKSNM